MSRKKILLTGLISAALIVTGAQYTRNAKSPDYKPVQTQQETEEKIKAIDAEINKEFLEEVKEANRITEAAVKPKEKQETVIYTERFKQQAKKTVIDYITNLDSDNFSQAYNMLSAESKKLHRFDEFQKDCQYRAHWELDTAKVEETKEGLAVILSMSEDIAEHDFSIAKENNKPKIVYRIGTPYWPYDSVK